MRPRVVERQAELTLLPHELRQRPHPAKGLPRQPIQKVRAHQALAITRLARSIFARCQRQNSHRVHRLPCSAHLHRRRHRFLRQHLPQHRSPFLRETQERELSAQLTLVPESIVMAIAGGTTPTTKGNGGRVTSTVGGRLGAGDPTKFELHACIRSVSHRVVFKRRSTLASQLSPIIAANSRVACESRGGC